MTYRELTKQIKKAETLLLRATNILEKVKSKNAIQKLPKTKNNNPFLSAFGIWKEKPRTQKDLEKIRKIIW